MKLKIYNSSLTHDGFILKPIDLAKKLITMSTLTAIEFMRDITILYGAKIADEVIDLLSKVMNFDGDNIN